MADIDWGLVAVFALTAFFLGWYYAAFIYSRRLAGRIATELKDAVLALGGISQIRWFGTTAFRMTTEGAKPPFRDISVTVTLRPREMPINWAIGTAQRRRDAALVEASLGKAPTTGLELIDPLTRVGRRRRSARTDWSIVSLDGRVLLLSADDERRARPILEALGPDALRPIMALHVTAGSQPGVAASISVQKDEATQGLATIRVLAERLTG